jgi:hypothetical protein
LRYRLEYLACASGSELKRLPPADFGGSISAMLALSRRAQPPA